MVRSTLAPARRLVGEPTVGLAVALVGVALLLAGGLAGAVVAVAVGVTWLGTGTPYAFAVGQVALVVALDGGPVTAPAAQTALLGLLVVDTAAGHDRETAARVAAVAVVSIAGLVALVGSLDSLLAGVGAAALVTTVAVYGIHRYERLELGLVGDPA